MKPIIAWSGNDTRNRERAKDSQFQNAWLAFSGSRDGYPQWPSILQATGDISTMNYVGLRLRRSLSLAAEPNPIQPSKARNTTFSGMHRGSIIPRAPPAAVKRVEPSVRRQLLLLMDATNTVSTTAPMIGAGCRNQGNDACA
jgi:hypothetical protein